MLRVNGITEKNDTVCNEKTLNTVHIYNSVNQMFLFDRLVMPSSERK